MIRLRVSGGNFDPIFRLLDSVAHPDLTPLANTIGTIMVEGNRRGLLEGTDSFGDRMTDLRPSTLRRRKGDGPPLIPDGEGSSFIAGFGFEVQASPDRTLIIGSWNVPYVHFHATGTANMVARDPVDIRPSDVELIAEATGAFARTLIGGRA